MCPVIYRGAFRPRYLMSYTSTAAALAEELLRSGWRAPDELKAIIGDYDGLAVRSELVTK